MQKNVKLFRHRYIPAETVELKNDEILFIDSDIIVTKWRTLKPRPDFTHGYSIYYLKSGFKVSQFLKEDGTLYYNYCDIIEAETDEKTNSIIVHDLIVDVVVYENGLHKVLDLNELADAFTQNIIPGETVSLALRRLSSLLNIIYENRFENILDDLRRKANG